MSALTASSNEAFKGFYERLVSAKKAPKAAMVAVARTLLVLAFTVIDTGRTFDPDYLSQRLNNP